MIPLAICSLVSVTLVLLRFVALRRESVLPAVVEHEIERFQPGAAAPNNSPGWWAMIPPRCRC